MSVSPITEFTSRDDAARYVAGLIEGSLRGALGLTGEAGLWLSGGSTPGPVFEHLSHATVRWNSVRIGLVDDRFVPENDPRSNAGLVRRLLLQDQAADPLTFLPLVVDGEEPVADAKAMHNHYSAAFTTQPTVLLGMGNDGHTASWFPGVTDLEDIMSINNPSWVAAVDASGAPVAGDAPIRLTLTGTALSKASFAILYITGQEKRDVLENRSRDLPIHHAERILGDRLITVWAP